MLKKDEKMLDGECHPAFFLGRIFVHFIQIKCEIYFVLDLQIC